MIVFTITNNITDDVWVGTCKESSDERFQQYQEAMALGIKHSFYKDLRDFGVQNFIVDDFAVAEDREELRELFEEAMDTYEGKSLVGVKTSLGKTSIAKMAPLASSAPKAAKRTLSTTSVPARAASSSSKATSTKMVKEKLSTGRTGSAKKEKSIKERIEAEKAAREAEKSKQIMEQADEMAAILARLDSRGSTLRKR